MRVALVSREVYPLSDGGIGQFVSAAASLLASVAEVTVVTTSRLEGRHAELLAGEDSRLPRDVKFAFVAEPTTEDAHAWLHVMQCYSARAYERLRELYPDGGPDIVEFADYLGEGFVTLQAAEARDPFLAGTRVCVRAHTSAELCAVLNASLHGDPATRALHEMERFSLARADRVIHQSRHVLSTYSRFYGAGAIAPATQIRYPLLEPVARAGDDRDLDASAPLRILYTGRMERRKGVHNLVRAVTALGRYDVRLTLIGGDTPTAPLGVSMRDHLRLAIAGDPRIALREHHTREGVAAAIRAHDLVAVPSMWECWPYAALDALRLNRPVLATPVGGLAEIVRPGRSGWLAEGTAADAIGDALDRILERRDDVAALARAGSPREHVEGLADPAEIVAGYEALAAEAAPRAKRPVPRTMSPPLVSAIVPYHRAAAYVTETIESLLRQTYPRLEIVVVNDGSFDPEDRILADIAMRAPVTVITQMQSGLGSARNLGVLRSGGRYFFPLDADNVAHPEFVARCVEILEECRDVAYVTSWSRYVDVRGAPVRGANLGYEPLGNRAELNADENVAGDGAAVVRRRLFDAGFRYNEELASLEDWHLYRELQQSGHYGVVIPERLIDYRVRADSMSARVLRPRNARLRAEIDAHLRASAVSWTC